MAHFEFYDLPTEAKDKLMRLRAEISGNEMLLAGYRLLRVLRKANFNPDQPRNPAGQGRESGRWSGEGGAGSGTSTTRQEALARIAQNDRTEGYPTDLLEEEQRGGHTISDHVGKSSNTLLTIVRNDRGEAGIISYARIRDGSFPSVEAATKLVNSTLAQNSVTVTLVAKGIQARALITAKFASKTGIEAYRPSPNGTPYVRDTYGVGSRD